MTYAEKLLDPRWQLKRIAILERDDWECQRCLTSFDESILDVHHLQYLPGHEPWEYEDEDLITLCRSCHDVVTAYKIPFAGIHNKWLVYELIKKTLPVMSPAAYEAEICRISNNLSL